MLAAFVNALALVAIVGWIAVEAVRRLFDPVEILGGLMLAVELHEDAGPARPVVEALRERGILAKDTHGQTIRFSPPLVIERGEVDWALERIATVLR